MKAAGAEDLFSGGGVYRRSKVEQGLKQRQQDLLVCFLVVFLIFTANVAAPGGAGVILRPQKTGLRQEECDSVIAMFWKALSDLGDPAIRKMLALSVVAAIVIFAALFGVTVWALSTAALTAMPWVDMTIDVLGGLAAVMVAWLLFPGTVSAFLSLFLDTVATAVERRDYPGLPPARQTPVLTAVLDGLRLLGLTVGLNLLVLPLYLVPVVNLAVFAVLNGYLLSREYFELAALRRMAKTEVAALRRTHRLRIWGTGMVLAGLLVIPGVNLLAPIIGVAVMVHMVQRLRPAA